MAELNFNDYRGIIGNPTNPYQQAYNDTCAIKSQQLILNEFGIDVTEDQLVMYSSQHGWYNGQGTAMEDVGRLLVDAGIPCTQSVDANVYDLANELAQGHKVIVAVDSGELWNKGIMERLEDIFMGDRPDHALIVAGLDLTDPYNPMVILTDPGTGQPAQPYPLDQFMDAWGDSQNFMVSTDIPTPDAMDAFAANGMMDMHLPEIAGVDYPTFQEFHSYSHLIDPSQLPELNFAFQSYPTMPVPDFSMAIENAGLPLFDVAFMDPNPTMFDPMTFNYGMLDDSWITDSLDISSLEENEIDSQTYDKLTQYHDEALEHAERCLENGDYVSAQIWQNQAHEIQSDLDDLDLISPE